MTLDGFLQRRYDARSYRCSHFAIEVWEYLKGRPVAEQLGGFLVPGMRLARLGHVQGVQMLSRPQDPCFVLMRSAVRPPHVGVLHLGRVIHLLEGHRVQYQPLEVVTLGYTRVRYFTC